MCLLLQNAAYQVGSHLTLETASCCLCAFRSFVLLPPPLLVVQSSHPPTSPAGRSNLPTPLSSCRSWLAGLSLVPNLPTLPLPVFAATSLHCSASWSVARPCCRLLEGFPFRSSGFVTLSWSLCRSGGNCSLGLELHSVLLVAFVATQ